MAVAIAYPFAGFGTFLFARDEQPIHGTDTRWARAPSYSRQRPLGSAIDSIVTMAIGSAQRTFECYLSPDRFDALEALMNTAATFTDWKRPTPDSRPTFLETVQPVDQYVKVLCSDGVTRRRVRTSVTLVTQ